MATEKTPSSKHGRLHEEEARRDKSGPTEAFGSQKPFEGSALGGSGPGPIAKPDAETKAKVVEETRPKGGSLAPAAPKPAVKTRPDITARMDALRSALSDKYPHNDVEVIPEGLKVAVPTGHITIESEKVAACADNAAIRAYIDALPIQ